MPRDTRLTLWPEQMAYYPLINSWHDIKKKDTLDFTECFGVHSCGLAATLLNLDSLFIADSKAEQQQLLETGIQTSLFGDEQKFHNKSNHASKRKSNVEVTNKNIITKIFKHKNFKLMHDCIDLNFFVFIKNYLHEKYHEEYCSKVNKHPIESSYFSINALSYPVFKLNFSKQISDRRDALLEFLDYFVPVFRKMSEQYLFKWEQFIPILYEIAQNSADHTENDAYIGLDFIISKSSAIAHVLIGDLGPGIFHHICGLPITENTMRKNKVGFAEAYRMALKDGFTSKDDSSRNKGRGMAFIINNSKALGVHLSVVDAFSRLILSSLNPIIDRMPSHNEIWRISHRMDGKKPFFYYLQYEVPLK